MPMPPASGGMSQQLIHVANERDRVQDLLQMSERRFHAVFDQSPQFLSLLQPDGTLIEANQTALAYRGVTLNQIVGRKYWNTFGNEFPAHMQETIHLAVERAAAGKLQQYELDIRAMENQVATVDFSITPVRDSVGEVVLLIAQGRDITELRRTLDRLRLAEFRLEEAQRIAHMGHWDYNLAGEEASWSNTLFDIFGMSQTEDTPDLQALSKLVHPDDTSYLREVLQHSFRTGRSYEVDFQSSGRMGWCQTLRRGWAGKE